MIDKKWEVLSELKTQNLKLKTEDIVNILLKNRGIKTKQAREEFLNPKLESVNVQNVGINNVQLKKTIKRINEAIKKSEKIIIYGDYDVDGICGTAILWETLFASYKNVIPYIPHRVDEGYGLSIAGISNIKDKVVETGLIITVDNGIVANDAVEFAAKNGFDVIITDHHVPSKKLPPAYAVVHTTNLCGTGVAYLLAQEFRNQLRNQEVGIKNHEEKHLELVALATVADLVPLVGANRTLVKFGIESLKNTKRPGLLALFSDAQIKKEEIDVYKIGHIIGPRLNASGRITHAMDSLRLICTRDAVRAKLLAQTLGETNRERQMLTQESTDHANLITEVSGKIIFVHHEDYNQGVIGLIASRLVEKHYKPSIVVAVSEKISKGSARSVAGFNIIEFLRTFSKFLIDAGGHPMAAGFTIETSRIEEFKKALISGSTKKIPDQLLQRILKIDCELGFGQINPGLFESLQKLAPFGMKNPEPLFVSKNIKVENARIIGRDNKHLKLALSQNEKTFEAIYFNGAEQGLKTGDAIDIVYSLEKNEWNGNEKMQLKIRDSKIILV